MATLHDEVIINGMRLRNRIALPPLTTNFGSPEGLVTDEIIQFYKDRSREVGLVIVEATAVRDDGRIVWDCGRMDRWPVWPALLIPSRNWELHRWCRSTTLEPDAFPAEEKCKGPRPRDLPSGLMSSRSP